MKHLAGDHSDEWIEAFKKFLRKENPWGNNSLENESNDLTTTEKRAIELNVWLPTIGFFPTHDENKWVAADEYIAPFYPGIKGFGVLLGERKYRIPFLRLFKIRRTVLGNLFFEGQKWRFIGYGEKYMPKMEELAKSIEEKFNITVSITLADIYPKNESEEYFVDYAAYY